MLFEMSSSTSTSVTVRAESRRLLSPTHTASTPSRSSSAIWASMSRIRGTLWRRTSSSVSRQAARIGSAAFLLPAALTSPRERRASLDHELLHGSG